MTLRFAMPMLMRLGRLRDALLYAEHLVKKAAQRCRDRGVGDGAEIDVLLRIRRGEKKLAGSSGIAAAVEEQSRNMGQRQIGHGVELFFPEQKQRQNLRAGVGLEDLPRRQIGIFENGSGGREMR